MSFERFFDEFHIFSTLRRTRFLQYCLRSHAERRSVPSRCSSSRSFRAAHTEKSGHYFYDDPGLAVGVMSLGMFAVFYAFLGLLFGVEALPISNSGVVDIHAFRESSEQPQQPQQPQQQSINQSIHQTNKQTKQVCIVLCLFRDQQWMSSAGSPRELLGDVMSGGCARCFGTSSRPSAWPWQLLSTTVLVRRRRWRCSRTAPHGDRRTPPGPGRRWSTRRTTAHGHRRLHLRGRGRASSRSRGTPQGGDLPTSSLAGASGESIDASSVRYLFAAARLDQSRQRVQQLRERDQEWDNRPTRRSKKRKKNKLPRGRFSRGLVHGNHGRYGPGLQSHVVVSGSGICKTGFATLPRAVFLFVVVRPRCSTSWPVRIRSTVTCFSCASWFY